LNNLSQIITLFKKDLLLEIRQQYSFYGILLYVASTTFVLFLAIDQPESRVWNGLFWTIQLFVSINAVAKSFLQESRGRMLYFGGLVSPQNFILAKLLYNTALMLVMSLLSLLLFSMFFGNPSSRLLQFLGIVLLGGWSLGLVFSFLAAIAARASQNAAIMVILGFPLIIPQLVMLMKISATVFTATTVVPLTPLLMLVVLDFLVILLSVILFPFLWKD
jgi:heme exporter protein B